MKFGQIIFLTMMLLVAFSFGRNMIVAAGWVEPERLMATYYEDGDFPLFFDDAVADILIDSRDLSAVRRAANDLQSDLQLVTGKQPVVKTNTSHISKNAVIIGTLDNSKFIAQLVKEGKLDVENLQGRWESFVIQTVEQPIPGIDYALVIAGSDMRGTIFGIYELSEQIGVSPWYWWADVTPQRKDLLAVKPGIYQQGEPTVQYRGIFINDEYMLTHWSNKTNDPGKRIGPETYKRIFELLLRLKANFLWPAMNQVGESFYANPLNAKYANDYGIVVGSTHVDMLLRNNNHEWNAWAAKNRKPNGALPIYDYSVDPDYVYRYWEERIKDVKDYENAYSIGMRAIHDEPMPAANVRSEQGKIELLEKIFADQRELISKWINKDVSAELQLFTPYKEVLDYYRAGLKVPDDVTIIWPNDNHGFLRDVPNEEERQRSGGHGLYYHQSYLGPPGQTYLWQGTTPLSLMASELNKAIEYGIEKLWVLNVGNLKTREIPIDFMMRLAWNIDSWDPANVVEYLTDFADKTFGSENAQAIAEIMMQYYQYNIARRPELMQKGVYSLSNYGDEGQKRLNDFICITKEAEEIYNNLPDRLQAAFYELILYPVRSSAQNFEKYIAAERSVLFALQNRGEIANIEAAKAEFALKLQEKDVDYYNFSLSGGKWRYFLDPFTDVNSASLPHYAWLEKMPSVGNVDHVFSKPSLGVIAEGQISAYEDSILQFSVFTQDSRFIDVYNSGGGVINWQAGVSHDWIKLTKTAGGLVSQERLWVDIDWSALPNGENTGFIYFTAAGQEKTIIVTADKPEYPLREQVVGHIEANGYVSIEAEHYYEKQDKGGSRWEVYAGLGRSGDSLKAVPDLAASFTEDIRETAPVVQYRIYFFSTGTFPIEVHRVPTLAPMSGRVGISIDSGQPEILVGTNDVTDAAWRKNILEHIEKVTGSITIDEPGYHVLNVWLVDPGVIIDKILIDTGGLAYSYFGPPESYNSFVPYNSGHVPSLSFADAELTDAVATNVITPVFSVEAEDMTLTDYQVEGNFGASEGQYIFTDRGGTAEVEYNGPPGIYNIQIDYFADSFSKYLLYLNDEKIDEWESVLITRGVTTGDGTAEEKYNSVKAWISQSADMGFVPDTRNVKGISLKSGDQLKIVGNNGSVNGAKLDRLQIVESDKNGWGAFLEVGGQVYINADAAKENSQYAYVIGRSSHLWDVRKGVSGLAMEVMPANGSHWTNTRVIRSFSPEMSYKIKVTKPGDYNMWLLVKANSSTKDSIHVGLDGIYRFSNENTMAKEFMWVNVGKLVNVSAGYHNLNLWAREDGIIIEQIYLSYDARMPKTAIQFEREK